ncbi:MAG: biopolymer transporter ExbD [Natronohydrobacter sp.]|nr:biopolymer transporter ExbD [Natronohydrobacter sp.]MCC5968051.1 biopolymer transporter ExbD [Natronohydrobacter sp.]
MFCFASPRPARRPSLTPMIDVVFLLLVFFMLAARFGQDVGLTLAPAGSDGERYEGPPRLVEFDAEGLWLNGAAIAREDLADALDALMPHPEALVILRPRDGANVQDLTRLTEMLQGAGIARVVVMEP